MGTGVSINLDLDKQNMTFKLSNKSWNDNSDDEGEEEPEEEGMDALSVEGAANCRVKGTWHRQGLLIVLEIDSVVETCSNENELDFLTFRKPMFGDVAYIRVRDI